MEDLVNVHTCIAQELRRLGPALKEQLDSASDLIPERTKEIEAEMVNRQRDHDMYLRWLSEQVGGKEQEMKDKRGEEIKDKRGEEKGIGEVQ